MTVDANGAEFNAIFRPKCFPSLVDVVVVVVAAELKRFKLTASKSSNH